MSNVKKVPVSFGKSLSAVTRWPFWLFFQTFASVVLYMAQVSGYDGHVDDRAVDELWGR